MNFKTETTFEGRVLNGKIVEKKVVLDELFGVSLVDEVKLDRQQVKKLMYDLSTLHSEMKDSAIGKDSSKINDESIQGTIAVGDINTLNYIDLIETIGKRLEVFGKHDSTKSI